MCGIFGIINAEKKPFDYQTFCTLGICNDERGGDSCGVFIDGKYEYGVDKQKLFIDFYQNSELIQKTNKARIALGHCRKASVGAINKENAQPVIIEEDGKVSFVVVHNGTIYDYERLAAKYIPQIDITGMTDSQVMARIFYYAGYDVLQEYNGGAAFVIVDYRKEQPEALMFKGSSLVNVNGLIDVEERPLYLTISNGTLIFSSIGRFLPARRKHLELFTCPKNTLCRVDKDGDLQEVQVYDRSGRYQFRRTEGYYGYYDEFGRYVRYEDTNNRQSKGYNKSIYNNYSDRNGGDRNNNEQKPLLITEGRQISRPKFDRFISSNDDGTYNVDNTLAQGFYFINQSGQIVSAKDKNNGKVHVFFFWQGVMLYNKECYKFLKKMAKAYSITEGQLIEDYPLVVHFLSPDPFCDNQSFNDGVMYMADGPDNFQVFSNLRWQYFMSRNRYFFDKEGIISTSWEVDKEDVAATYDDYVKMNDDMFIDFSYLIDNYKIY